MIEKATIDPAIIAVFNAAIKAESEEKDKRQQTARSEFRTVFCVGNVFIGHVYPLVVILTRSRRFDNI